MYAGLIIKDLKEVVKAVSSITGVDISVYSETFLSRSINKRISITFSADACDYAALLMKNPCEAEKLAFSLNISYSSFFRNRLTFSLLEHFVLPVLMDKKEKTGNPEIRVWSACCSSGEEAYSLAILLDELNLKREHRVAFRIFATDISQAALDLANRGIYGPEALNNIRQSQLNNYFISNGGSYEIIPRLKQYIDFSIYDLLEKKSVCPPPSIYGEFDIIICSNILFYYRPDIQQGVLEKLGNCLANEGYMVTGEAEKSIVEQNKSFKPVKFPFTIFKKIQKF